MGERLYGRWIRKSYMGRRLYKEGGLNGKGTIEERELYRDRTIQREKQKKR